MALALLAYDPVTGNLCGDQTALEACCMDDDCPNAQIKLTVTGITIPGGPPPDCDEFNVTELILRPIRSRNFTEPISTQCVHDVTSEQCYWGECIEVDGERWFWEVGLTPPELTSTGKWRVVVQVSYWNYAAGVLDWFAVWNGPEAGGYIDYSGSLCGVTFDFDVLNLCTAGGFPCDESAIDISGEVECVAQDTVQCPACHRCPESLQVTVAAVGDSDCDTDACDLINASWTLPFVEEFLDETTCICDLLLGQRCQWTQKDIGTFICDDGEYEIYLCRVDAWVVVPNGDDSEDPPYTVFGQLFFQGWFSGFAPDDKCEFGPDASWTLAFENDPIATACESLDETFDVCFDNLTFCDGTNATIRVRAAP